MGEFVSSRVFRPFQNKLTEVADQMSDGLTGPACLKERLLSG